MKKYIKADFDIDESKAFNPDENVRALMARKTSDPELMELYLYDPSDYVRGMLAENKHIPDEYLTQLSMDTDYWVRKQVASNPRTPPEILDVLARDAYADVRDMVAMNPHAWGRTLARFVDGVIVARVSIAGNPSTPPEILDQLSHSSIPNIRWEVAANSKTPESVLRQLLNDVDSEVRKEAQSTLDMLSDARSEGIV